MKNHREPVLYEGLQYVFPLAFLSLIILIIGRPFLSILPISIAIFIAFFFRNPGRKVPAGEGIIVAPADGKVILIQNVTVDDQLEEEGLKDKSLKISIFLSLFDVHINRIPCSGEIVELRHKRGKFLPAFKDGASIENEQVSMLISYNDYKILVKQIAGVIARRIVCWASVGDKIERGQRYGLIRFGSRVDIFLPDRIELRVKIGEKVKGGETILGVLR